MKKLIIVVVALLLICLSVTPVAAKSESGIFFKVVGELNSSNFGTAKLTITADSVKDIIIVEVKWDKKVLWPGWGAAPIQWMKGMRDAGPLGVWEVSEDGSSITIFTETSQVTVLPSGDLVGDELPKVLQGTITGNQVTFVVVGESEITPLTGKIKIK